MARFPSPLTCRAALREDLARLIVGLPHRDDEQHPTRRVRRALGPGAGDPGALLTPVGLARLYDLYDEIAFGGLLSGAMRALPPTQGGAHGRPLLRVSNRMTRTAGKTTHRSVRVSRRTMRRAESIEIAISAPLLGAPVDAERGVLVSGRRCFDRVAALQRVFEHELVHMLLFCVGWDARCSRGLFRELASDLFGHRSSKHELTVAGALVTPAPHLDAPALVVRPGDRVRFEHRGTRHEGVVNRITKRATVLVPDPRGRRYTDGERYVKFYVPIPLLERVA